MNKKVQHIDYKTDTKGCFLLFCILLIFNTQVNLKGQNFKTFKDSCFKESDRILVKNIRFDYNKAIILTESYSILDSLVVFICNYDSLAKIEIGVHSDYTEYEINYSYDLTLGRANSILQYLVLKGIPTEKLKSIGYGCSKPIANNKTAEGRAKNRRIEFTLIKINKKK